MKINVVTAVEHKYFPPKSLKIFLAGGITNCNNWQDTVIETVQEVDEVNYDSVYFLNPRRKNFVMAEGETEKQIEWEFDMLERCDMFTMFFAGGESLQPICQYELGRNIEKMKVKFPFDWEKRIVITCDSSYKRKDDVLIQTRLATNGKVKVEVVDSSMDVDRSAYKHAQRIQEQIKYVYPEDYE